MAQLTERDFPKELNPGITWQHALESGPGCDDKFDLKITWVDDSPEPGSFEARLSPIYVK